MCRQSDHPFSGRACAARTAPASNTATIHNDTDVNDAEPTTKNESVADPACKAAHLISQSPAQTQAIAATLAHRLVAGQCIALHGDLGAGKTQFVRGLLEGLGGDPRRVSSPTYVLLNVYDEARLPLYHLDAYRITGSADFEAIGFPELLEQGGIVVVEWAERILELLPSSRTDVTITPMGEEIRQIEVQERR